eukprot:CAMPEP_0180006476 /NCGR_PEP_ID=MMETSP0984-20121128/13317_1 /TAXON_ID=483367 /ORGANISM="non described non described, Strain CCMP 2436" /LENGTH=64 /DNA_ID=CAMNT_0021927393 /DNA_START=134 /DNA_END=325 /DNA_ORIENTATION=+
MSARPRPCSRWGPTPLQAAGNLVGRRDRDWPVAARRPDPHAPAHRGSHLAERDGEGHQGNTPVV